MTVLPVNIEMGPKQNATTLTVINHGDSEATVQVRALAWTQPDGVEQLVPSDELLISPPIATIAAGAMQVVRLILRHPPQGREATYRILLDQIPPAASPGTVRLALRLSIPVFAAPTTRALSHVQFHVETKAGQAYLVARNDGARHATMRDLVLKTSSGQPLTLPATMSPYILAGTTSQWLIGGVGRAALGGSVRLTGISNAAPVDLPVAVTTSP